MLISVVILAYLVNPKEYVYDLFLNGEKIALSTLLGVLSGLLFSYAYFTLDSQHINLQDIPKLWWINIILKSVSEELLYRGILITEMRKRDIATGLTVVLQAILFALSHFESSSSVQYLGVTFLFGMISGFLMLKFKNLLPSSVMHVVTNMILLYGFSLF